MDLRLDDPAVWPTLEEVFGADDATTDAGAASSDPLTASGHSASSSVTSNGWEHVAFPDGGSGDHWVLIEEEVVEGAGGSAASTIVTPALTMGDMAALALAEEQQEGEEEDAVATAAPTGAGRMSYRDALTANTMDGDEGTTGLPSARRFFPLAGMAARRKRAKMAERAEKEEDEEGWEGGGSGLGFQEEYALTKAVSVRTRKHCGRKRLTETGKARMAAKIAKRQEAKQGAGGGGGSGDEGGDDAMEW